MDRYAVIGNPIAHSKSPLIHTAFARQTGQVLDYTRVEAPTAPPSAFADSVRAFRDAGGRGMNVTAPFKLLAFELADERLPRAELAGAANALKFDAGRIVADNFDGIGLVNDIQRNLGLALRGQRVLLLGAGGATRGALLPFLQQQPAALVVANRTLPKAQALAAAFAAHGELRGCGLDALAGQRFDIVLNATSASQSTELPPLPAEVFDGCTLAYELVYGKGLTPFLKLAAERGVPRLADGVGMLVEQAAEAFVWWRGVRPDTAPLIRDMTVPLA